MNDLPIIYESDSHANQNVRGEWGDFPSAVSQGRSFSLLHIDYNTEKFQVKRGCSTRMDGHSRVGRVLQPKGKTVRNENAAEEGRLKGRRPLTYEYGKRHNSRAEPRLGPPLRPRC